VPDMRNDFGEESLYRPEPALSYAIEHDALFGPMLKLYDLRVGLGRRSPMRWGRSASVGGLARRIIAAWRLPEDILPEDILNVETGGEGAGLSPVYYQLSQTISRPRPARVCPNWFRWRDRFRTSQLLQA